MLTQVSNIFKTKKNQYVNETSIKLFTLKLSNVMNSFDAHSLWDHRYGSQKDIVEPSSNKSDFRLKKALDKYRRVVNSSGEGKWMMKTEKVFSDVILWIPEPVWQDDIEVGANSLAMLANSLARFHTDDFKKDIFAGRPPAYVVMPDPTLGQGEVRFQFGMGVYVPKIDEAPIAGIEIKMQGQAQWKKLPEWYFWEDSRMTRKPVGIYQDQQGIIIGADHDAAVVTVNGDQEENAWFPDLKGAVFINYALQSLNYAFGDGHYISRNSEIDSRDEKTGQIVFKFMAQAPALEDPSPDVPDTDNKVLLLKITPLDNGRHKDEPQTNEQDVQAPEPGAPPAQESKERHEDKPEPKEKRVKSELETIVVKEESSGFRTIIIGPDSFDQEESSPFAGVPHMVLEGYALPRIDLFKVPGLDSWEIWFGNQGDVVDRPAAMDDGSIKPDGDKLAISGTRLQNELYILGQERIEPELIEKFPRTLTLESGVAYEVDELPENNFYAGVIKLPKPDRFFPLEDQKLILGRGELVDIQMDLLPQPEFLRWEKGKEQRQACLGLINLSRDHAECWLEEDTLTVKNISSSAPLFILRTDDTLDKIEQNRSDVLMMKSGDRLLMGCCLLRYENDCPQKEEASRFSLKAFMATKRFTVLVDRLKGKKKLSADESSRIEVIQQIIKQHQHLDNILTISPEDYIRHLDLVEGFLTLSGADNKDINTIKQAKIDYLNRFK